MRKRTCVPWPIVLMILVAFAGCDGHAGAATEQYEPGKMDLSPRPARIVNESHSGTFAGGAALSTTALLKPLDPSPVKEIRLDTVHKIVDIAPGVRFSAWTFGDQLPG